MDINNNKYLKILNKVLLNHASEEEKELLEQWSKKDKENQAFVEETIKVWNLSEQYAEDLPVDTDAAWEKFETKLGTASVQASQTPIRVLNVFWKAAAIVGILFFAYWWGSSSNELAPVLAKIETGDEQQKEVILPDGSVVMLNESSKLSYKEAFEPREVHLEGEAFFEVTKQAGESFEIITNTTKTTVLGTSFNVRAYKNEDVEVAVVTGKVAVEGVGANKEKVLLLPNEVAHYNAETNALQKEETSSANALAWKTRELVFKNTELSEVVNTLERYFGVEITGDAPVLKCHYTGRFKNSDLDEIFSAIAFTFPTDLEVKKVGKKYILIGQGCE